MAPMWLLHSFTPSLPVLITTMARLPATTFRGACSWRFAHRVRHWRPLRLMLAITIWKCPVGLPHSLPRCLKTRLWLPLAVRGSFRAELFGVELFHREQSVLLGESF